MPASLRPPFAIILLGLLFFSSLVAHPSWELYSDSSDLLNLLGPAQRFLVGSWRQTGELPLWCPTRFGGSPFLHDLQVAAFYPPHLVLYLVPDWAITPAMSWLAVAHVILAGLLMYGYARSRALQQGPALVAAIGFMFSGKWMLHLLGGGHYTTIGIAWLPLVLLLLEAAIRKRSFVHAAWSGTVFALLALSMHPQWTVYAGLFVAAWTCGTALESAGYWRGEATLPRVSASFSTWLACGACAATVALLLISVQLLPMLEAVSQATRGAAGATGVSLSKLPTTLFSLLGPPALGMKSFDDWEYRGGIGVLWACTALVAARTSKGQGRYQVGVWLGLIVFSLGAAVLFERLPGFRMFAYPSRMLLIAAFPTAFLAGSAIQTLFSGPSLPPAALSRWRGVLVRLTAAAVASFGALALLRGPRSVHGHLYWAALVFLVPAAFVTLRDAFAADWRVRRRASLAWTLLLLADAWALARPHVETRPESALLSPPRCVDYVVQHSAGHGRVLDRHLPGEVTRTPLSPGLAMTLGVEAVRGYNPLDIRRFREYLQLIADRDAPVPALRQVGNFPIRNKPLIDLLGVRYLLKPSADDEAGGDEHWRFVLQDAQPTTFNAFAGVSQLPPYSLFENPDALPRAFVVPEAAPLPARGRLLSAFKANDFRRLVFLEGFRDRRDPASIRCTFQPARVASYEPNRVELRVELDAPGFLVLTDPWYPGWSCSVDGRPARLYRANFVFRAVEMSAGSHRVLFVFAPASFRTGALVSGTALAALPALTLLALLRSLRRRRHMAPHDASDSVPPAKYHRFRHGKREEVTPLVPR